VLGVSTLEPRKNLPALVAAVRHDEHVSPQRP